MKGKCRPSLSTAKVLGQGHETGWSLKLKNNSRFHARDTAKVIASNYSCKCEKVFVESFPDRHENQLHLDPPQKIFCSV